MNRKPCKRIACPPGRRNLSLPSKYPRVGGMRVVTKPPPKENFFNVRTPPGTSVDEVIDALETLVGLQEIYSVQHHGGFDFQVAVNSTRAVQVLLEFGGLRLGTRAVPLVPVARQVASVTCLYLPCYVRDNEAVTSEARYKDRPSIRIRTGTRYIKIDMRPENPLPNFARVGGHRATFEYRGVRRLCRRCNQEGHFRAQCETPHCAICGVFGHRTDTCTEGADVAGAPMRASTAPQGRHIVWRQPWKWTSFRPSPRRQLQSRRSEG
ncbi:hypothetical protein HPB51_028081 [Rhipicephalus microplus]|uniref:CCHC-type domain-containing protein n=1 Tax=Rhipicephalus microplus TaxID=6941 RepID=A0A9J6CYI6_RHIMP|nr:hypothetical protein HPB51_028081 [Rhipicephalus microplus]